MNPFRSRSKAAAEAERARDGERQRKQEAEREWERELLKECQKERGRQLARREFQVQNVHPAIRTLDLESEASIESPSEQQPLSPRTLPFGWKKRRPEPRKEIDIVDALPSNENFRTSLLMPKLSARFSVLRELEDVASLEESFKRSGPPFRPHMDQEVTEDVQFGKIMDRAKPRKGIRFFGGRQAVYRAADGAASRGFGRAFYEEDVNESSLIRRHRQGRRFVPDPQDGYASDIAEETRSIDHEAIQPSTPCSGQTSSDSEYSQRESGQEARRSPNFARSAERANGRRLYELSLDSHMLKHQTSVVGRLESKRASSVHSNSASSLGDRSGEEWRSARSDESTASMLTTGNTGIPVRFPSRSEQGGELALDPRDVGKATASGAFQRPQTPYSEMQFAKRQLRLQEGRCEPGRSSPPSRSLGESSESDRARDHGSSSRSSSPSAHQQEASALSQERKDGGAVQGWGGETSHASIFEPESRFFGRGTDEGRQHCRRRGADEPFRTGRPAGAWIDGAASHERQPYASAAGSLAGLGFSPDLESEGDLEDLVRHHLRSRSNASSVYPASMAGDEATGASRVRNLASPMRCG